MSDNDNSHKSQCKFSKIHILRLAIMTLQFFKEYISGGGLECKKNLG